MAKPGDEVKNDPALSDSGHAKKDLAQIIDSSAKEVQGSLLAALHQQETGQSNGQPSFGRAVVTAIEQGSVKNIKAIEALVDDKMTAKDVETTVKEVQLGAEQIRKDPSILTSGNFLKKAGVKEFHNAENSLSGTIDSAVNGVIIKPLQTPPQDPAFKNTGIDVKN